MEAKLTGPIPLPVVQADTVANLRRWPALVSLAAACLVDRSEDQALSILWPQIQQSLGASLGGLGPALGISRLVSIITLPLWGYASDRWSRRMLLVCFTGFWGLWTLTIGLVGSLSQLMAVRLISTLGAGVFAPAAFSLIGDLFDHKQRGRAAGIVLGAGTLGALVAAGVLPMLAARTPDGWRWGFAVMGIASCVTGLLLCLGLREPPRGGGEPELRGVVAGEGAQSSRITWADLRALSALASWRLLALTEALRAIGAALVLGWLFTWLTSIGLASSIILIVAAFLLSIFVGQLAFGWLGDYLAVRFPRYGQLTLTMIGVVLVVPVTMLFLASDGQNLTRLLIYALLSGFSGSVGILIWPIGQAVVPPELRGSSRAITEMLAGAASAVALVASGPVVDRMGVAPALLLLAPLPVVLSIGLWLPLYRTFPQDRAALQQQLAQRRALLLQER